MAFLNQEKKVIKELGGTIGTAVVATDGIHTALMNNLNGNIDVYENSINSSIILTISTGKEIEAMDVSKNYISVITADKFLIVYNIETGTEFKRANMVSVIDNASFNKRIMMLDNSAASIIYLDNFGIKILSLSTETGEYVLNAERILSVCDEMFVDGEYLTLYSRIEKSIIIEKIKIESIPGTAPLVTEKNIITDYSNYFSDVNFEEIINVFIKEDFFYFITRQNIAVYDTNTYDKISLEVNFTSECEKACFGGIGFVYIDRTTKEMAFKTDEASQKDYSETFPAFEIDIISGNYIHSEVELLTNSTIELIADSEFIYAVKDMAYRKIPLISKKHDRIIGYADTLKMRDLSPINGFSDKNSVIMSKLMQTASEVKKIEFKKARTASSFVSDRTNYFSLEKDGVMISDKIVFFRKISEYIIPALRLNSNKASIGYSALINARNDKIVVANYIDGQIETLKTNVSASEVFYDEDKIVIKFGNGIPQNGLADIKKFCSSYLFSECKDAVYNSTDKAYYIYHNYSSLNLFKDFVNWFCEGIGASFVDNDEAASFSPHITIQNVLSEEALDDMKILFESFEDYLPATDRVIKISSTGVETIC